MEASVFLSIHDRAVCFALHVRYQRQIVSQRTGPLDTESRGDDREGDPWLPGVLAKDSEGAALQDRPVDAPRDGTVQSARDAVFFLLDNLRTAVSHFSVSC